MSPEQPTAARPEPNVPLRIHAEREARTLAVEWSDGHATVYDFDRLRWLCPCAYCRGEAGLPGWLDSAPTLTTEQTRLVDSPWSASTRSLRPGATAITPATTRS